MTLYFNTNDYTIEARMENNTFEEKNWEKLTGPEVLNELEK